VPSPKRKRTPGAGWGSYYGVPALFVSYGLGAEVVSSSLAGSTLREGCAPALFALRRNRTFASVASCRKGTTPYNPE
jgi:hypothetical protein